MVLRRTLGLETLEHQVLRLFYELWYSTWNSMRFMVPIGHFAPQEWHFRLKSRRGTVLVRSLCATKINVSICALCTASAPLAVRSSVRRLLHGVLHRGTPFDRHRCRPFSVLYAGLQNVRVIVIFFERCNLYMHRISYILLQVLLSNNYCDFVFLRNIHKILPFYGFLVQ